MDIRLENAKNIVFDIGNVLLEFNPTKILGNFVSAKDTDIYLKHVFASVHWTKLDEGTTTIEDASKQMTLEAKGQIELDITRSLLENFQDYMERMPLSYEFDYLHSLNKGIYLLSNFHEQAFKKVLEKYEFLKEADGSVISSHVKLNKPNIKIYEALLDKYSLDPSTCVFLDDVEENITAAEKIGIRSIHYKNCKLV